MEHVSPRTLLPLRTAVASGGFASETCLATPDGPCAVSELRAGQWLLTQDGGTAEVLAVLDCGESGDWVTLPARAGEAAVTVAADQAMLCRHFLCAALFDVVEAVFRAGDLVGRRITRSQGRNQRFHLPVLDREASLLLSGYEFLGFSSQPHGSGAGEENRVGESGSSGDGLGPHPCSSYGGALSSTRVFLQPDQVRQLSDSGVLFRGARS